MPMSGPSGCAIGVSRRTACAPTRSTVSGHLVRHNERVTIAGEATAPLSPPARRVRLNRSVLVSNLASGASWLLIPVATDAWPLSVIGAVYIVAASLFLALVYAREAFTAKQEALAWAAPWLGAVLVWAAVIGAVEFENTASHYLAGLSVGLLLGTLCYLGWQMLALAIRQVLAWRSKTSSRLT